MSHVGGGARRAPKISSWCQMTFCWCFNANVPEVKASGQSKVQTGINMLHSSSTHRKNFSSNTQNWLVVLKGFTLSAPQFRVIGPWAQVPQAMSNATTTRSPRLNFCTMSKTFLTTTANVPVVGMDWHCKWNRRMRLVNFEMFSKKLFENLTALHTRHKILWQTLWGKKCHNLSHWCCVSCNRSVLWIMSNSLKWNFTLLQTLSKILKTPYQNIQTSVKTFQKLCVFWELVNLFQE